MNRRQMLAGNVALPAGLAGLSIAAGAPENGTDAVWPAYCKAKAETRCLP